MKHKLFIVLFFSLLGITISFANTVKITGQVLFMNDSTAVSGATVRLLNNNKTVITGTTTDAQGKFSITYKTTNNAHQIEVSFVGYIPVSININRGNNDINTGDIYLLEENKGLSEVVVTGALRKVNRQLVFPNKQQIKASQDFIALLQNLSLNGLFVDQINQKALIHNKPIQWKINGTPQSFNEVKNLSPNAILRIDYSEMPSVRELDKGFGGVINVILKERTDGGAIRSHLQSALWVGFINANANANYHKDKSDFTIHYSSNYRNYPKWQKTMEQDFFGDNIHINRSEIPENSPFKYLEQNINLTYTHKFNNNKMFSATWRNTINSQSNDVRNNITQSGKNTFHRSSKSLYKQYTPVLDLYFQNTLHNGGKIEANLVGPYH